MVGGLVRRHRSRARRTPAFDPVQQLLEDAGGLEPFQVGHDRLPKEREQLRRYYELELFHHEHPMFSLSWTLIHIVDETSPLRDMTPAKFSEVEGALALNVGGVDDNSAQRLYAR
jgi:hypothetical protein